MFGRFLFSVVFLSASAPSFGWEAHFLATFGALKDMPQFSQSALVAAETLENFVAAEKVGLTKLLKENEDWARQNIAAYPPLPKKLVFSPGNTGSATLRQRFLNSIRVNPDLPYALFLQHGPGVALAERNFLAPNEVMPIALADEPTNHLGILERTVPGQKVAPLLVVSTASDEPDYGIDIGLWEDNGTPFGREYAFGPQPFGNAKLIFGSQAPFHMGFFHESAVVNTLAGFIERCYPEYRIHTFMALSAYAFKTGHAYWGYRFLGWALHYVQDLAQPYHAKMAPGVSTPTLMATQGLQMVGFPKTKENMVQRLTDRHLGLENYTYSLLSKEFTTDANTGLKGALQEMHGQNGVAFSDHYSRQLITLEAHDRADVVDKLLSNLAQDKRDLNVELAGIFGNIGRHTRNAARSMLGS